MKRKFKKVNSGNFIKIAYSGNSMDIPHPLSKWVRDAPACEHLFRHMLEISRPCTQVSQLQHKFSIYIIQVMHI